MNDKKTVSFGMALAIIFLPILVILLGGLVLRVGFLVPLMLATITASLLSIMAGFTWKEVEACIVNGVHRIIIVTCILFLVGTLIGVWIQAGVIPLFLYWGLKLLSPSMFLVSTVLICAVFSLMTGTSFGTIGTAGLALLGVGEALGFPTGLTAGAIVSGAYFGDKMSPLSDTTNLAPAMAGATLFKHIKHMIYTTGTSLIIALIAYAIMGFMFASNNEADLSTMDMILGFIKEASIVNPLTLLPPLFVIVAVALKLPAIPALVVAALMGIPFFFMNSAFIEKAMGDPMTHNIFNILDYGISLGNVPDDASLIIQKLSSLLSASGLIGMFDTIAIILAAMCFGGILDVTGMMAQFAEKILTIAKGRGGLVLATELMSLITNAICCDQYLSLVLPGRMFKEKFEDMRLRPENLSRCLEDCGTITSNFFPWNTCGATMRKFLGIDSSYIPYAILNWLNPVVSIFFGYTGITMTKMTEEEYQHLLKVREEEKAVALAAMEA
mgnify:CR=1 FL=1